MGCGETGAVNHEVPGDCKPTVFRIVIRSNSAQLERPSGLASPGLHNKNVLDRNSEPTWVKTFVFSQLEKASLWRCVICISVTTVTRSSSRVGRLINFMVSIYRGAVYLVGRLIRGILSGRVSSYHGEPSNRGGRVLQRPVPGDLLLSLRPHFLKGSTASKNSATSKDQGFNKNSNKKEPVGAFKFKPQQEAIYSPNLGEHLSQCITAFYPLANSGAL